MRAAPSVSVLAGSLLLVAAAVLPACETDRVGPSIRADLLCGDGVVDEGEACDDVSEGCRGCQVAPGWMCVANECAPACGDGVTGEGEACASPRRAEACAMTGWWAARQTDHVRDTVTNRLQTASTWYLYRFAQEPGAARFTVVASLMCGLEVTGSATVTMSDATLRALVYANREDGRGEPARAARGGVASALGDGCAVRFDPWYRIRGATSEFLPADFDARPALATLRPFPAVKDPANDSAAVDGAVDEDGDGLPGVAFRVAGIVRGVRNSMQRDWSELATAEGVPFPPHAVEVRASGSFEQEESILRVSECGGACGLLQARAVPARDWQSRIVLRFLGEDASSPRASLVVRGAPRADLTVDLATCARVRALLPHEASE